MRSAIVLLCSLGFRAWAQEASSGVELSRTVSGLAADSHQLTAAPRDGSPLVGGFRAVLYPVWKLNEHWTISGAVQVHSRPYFYEEFSALGLVNVQDPDRVSRSLDLVGRYLQKEFGLTLRPADRNGVRRLGSAGEAFAARREFFHSRVFYFGDQMRNSPPQCNSDII